MGRETKGDKFGQPFSIDLHGPISNMYAFIIELCAFINHTLQIIDMQTVLTLNISSFHHKCEYKYRWFECRLDLRLRWRSSNTFGNR